MNLRTLADDELLRETQTLVQDERAILTKILQNLREIDRRRLYSEVGCSSLFDYAVKHLKYSEGQAGRRVQAARLLKEMPELESKIESGALSLSNLSQAQSFFRDAKNGSAPLDTAQKLEVLERLENKSAREGERELLRLNPQTALPKEKERMLTPEASEMRFVMTSELKADLEEVRSLLGPRGAQMSFGELVKAMADFTRNGLKARKFGKQRAEAESTHESVSTKSNVTDPVDANSVQTTKRTPTPEEVNPRYISKETKLLIWSRDHGACQKCGSHQNLNFDHITPIARGGASDPNNLRLLCFSCNQRAGIKIFGVEKMARAPASPPRSRVFAKSEHFVSNHI